MRDSQEIEITRLISLREESEMYMEVRATVHSGMGEAQMEYEFFILFECVVV